MATTSTNVISLIILIILFLVLLGWTIRVLFGKTHTTGGKVLTGLALLFLTGAVLFAIFAVATPAGGYTYNVATQTHGPSVLSSLDNLWHATLIYQLTNANSAITVTIVTAQGYPSQAAADLAPFGTALGQAVTLPFNVSTTISPANVLVGQTTPVNSLADIKVSSTNTKQAAYLGTAWSMFVIGVILFILSFLFPNKNKVVAGYTQETKVSSTQEVV